MLLIRCANPQAPSGGPRDETPPRVMSSSPARDAVNVSTRSIRIAFSEYVERSTLIRSISVTPAFDRALEYDWDGRAVEITFPSELRDSTTYIVTLDTELTDTRSVALNEPITIAFSTGPRINRGSIAGRVVEPGEGKPQAQMDIYAYAAPDGTPPDSLPDRPDYRTQTGDDGSFTLEYLREQPYYVIAIKDNNRNRRPDVLEPFGTPPRPVLPGDVGADPVRVPWIVARLDTIAPELQRVQPRSNRRLTLRFSEPVQPSLDPSDYPLIDSLRDQEQSIESVYARDIPSTEVNLLMTAAMEEGRHRLSIADSVIKDTLGTALPDTTVGFAATTLADTVTTRFLEFLPADATPDSTGAVPLLPPDQPGVQFNQPVGSSRFGTAIAARDTLGQPRTLTATTADGTDYRFTFEPPLSPGTTLEVAVDDGPFAGADTTYTRRFRRVTSKVLGELEGQAITVDTSDAPPADTTAADSLAGATDAAADSARVDTVQVDTTVADSVQADTTQTDSLRQPPSEEPKLRIRYQPVDSSRLAGSVIVELYATSSSIPVDRRTEVVGADTTFVFDMLPEGSYRFRAFLDRNGNGRWDPGRLLPYKPAEPVTWTEQPTESRPRWTTVLPAPLRIPVLARPIRIENLAESP
ncbi:Ig-like domain-containing protein [Longibacter salinarum]|nr:Ig-like domain-containing protein [Longibacter salinarum]